MLPFFPRHFLPGNIFPPRNFFPKLFSRDFFSLIIFSLSNFSRLFFPQTFFPGQTFSRYILYTEICFPIFKILHLNFKIDYNPSSKKQKQWVCFSLRQMESKPVQFFLTRIEGPFFKVSLSVPYFELTVLRRVHLQKFSPDIGSTTSHWKVGLGKILP